MGVGISGYGVKDMVLRGKSLVLRVQGLQRWVQGLWFWVSGLGVRDEGFGCSVARNCEDTTPCKVTLVILHQVASPDPARSEPITRTALVRCCSGGRGFLRKLRILDICLWVGIP